MRERNGLRRAAWRELWPATVFALALALVGVTWCIGDERPPSGWAVLVLLPAAFQAGLAVGRCSPRSLAFLFARPFARERLLAARVGLALASLATAVIPIAIVVVARTLDPSVAMEVALAFAIVVLAFACGLVGALSSDREPLGLGVGLLVFSAMPITMIWTVEILDINAARVIAAHPFALLAVITLEIATCFRAARRLWCDTLPVRDAAAVKRLLFGTARGWLPAQALCVALAWHSAAAEEGSPMIVLGGDARGPIVAAGSPGGRIDAVLAADGSVLLDATAGGETITRAVSDGERLAVTLIDHDNRCRVVLVDARHGERAIDRWCDRLLLSPSGATLAIVGREGIVYVDTASAITRRVDHMPDVVIVGWLGEELIVHGRENAGDRRLHAAARVVSELPVTSARLSPAGDRLAVRVAVRRKTTYDDGPARLAFIALADGSVQHEYEIALRDARVVGWLDDEHVAVYGGRSASTLVLLSPEQGEVHRAWIPHAFPPARIEGPAQGPWLLDRGGIVEAIAADGTQLWRENLATLERDNGDAHRWAIVDGEVIGIGYAGRWWRHALPWEASQ